MQTDRCKSKNNSGKKIIIIMVAIPVFILLLSTGLYYMANNKMVNLGTVNNGTLITPPLRLSDLNLKQADGQTFDYTKPERKWSFVVIGGKECDDVCERMLYISRQAHHALERRMPRIRRIYINQDSSTSEQLEKLLADEYKTTEMVYANNKELQALINQSAIKQLDENRFYVVDHNGWLMMYYQAQDTQQETLNSLGKEIIKDMKRLLK